MSVTTRVGVVGIAAVAAVGAVLATVPVGGQVGAADAATSNPFAALSVNGIPDDGHVLVGAATTTSYPAFEDSIDTTTGVHRTYYKAGQEDAAVATAAADIAAGRVPWVSFKTPHGWADMVAGKGDAWATTLAERLDALNGPVWIAIHHEPEGDGDPELWKAMQRRLAPMFQAKDNIAYSIILMGWNQFYGTNPAQSMDALWPGKEYVDILGFDPYNWYATTNRNSGKKSYTWTELNAYYSKINAWLDKTGNSDVEWAVAETGYTDAAAAVKQNQVAPNGKKVSTRGPGIDWLTRAYTDMQAQGGIALSYFNVSASVNGEPSDWTWPLSGAKLSTFAAVAAGTPAPEPTPNVTPSPTSSPTTATVDAVKAPAAPSAVTADTVTSQKVVLSWNATTGADTYTVARNGEPIATTSDPRYSDETVTEGTRYTYAVAARNSSGVSSATAVTVTTPTVIRHRGTATATGNSASITAPAAPGAANGDRSVMILTINTLSNVTTPAGWTRIGDASDQDMRSFVFTRTHDTAAPAPVLTLSSLSKYALTVTSYSGVDVSVASTVGAVETGAARTDHSAPASPDVSSNSLTLRYWADKSSATTSWALPAGATKTGFATGSASGRISSVIGTSAVTAPLTATANNASAKAIMWTVSLTGK